MIDIRRIVCAANRYGDIIICGARHFDSIMHSAIDSLDEHLSPKCPSEWEQGFIDTWGEFLNRQEAWKIACFTKQVRRLVGSQTKRDPFCGAELFSENLY